MKTLIKSPSVRLIVQDSTEKHDNVVYISTEIANRYEIYFGSFVQILPQKKVYTVLEAENAECDVFSIFLSKTVKLHLDVVNGDTVFIKPFNDLKPATNVSFSLRGNADEAVEFLSECPVAAINEGQIIKCSEKTFLLVKILTPKPYALLVDSSSTILVISGGFRVPKTFGKNWFDYVAGYKQQIEELKLNGLYCLQHRKFYKNVGAKVSKGILLYGPSGTGKTTMIRALRAESRLPAYYLNDWCTLSDECTGIEITLKDLFETARKNAPSFIIIEDLDVFAHKRSNKETYSSNTVCSLLLALMDRIMRSSDVIVIGETNQPLEVIDEAFFQCGRFGKLIELKEPTFLERKEILVSFSKKRSNQSFALLSPYQKLDLDFNKIASETEGFVGADLKKLYTEAWLKAIDSDLALDDDYDSYLELEDTLVKQFHFTEALTDLKQKRYVLKGKSTSEVKWRDVVGIHDIQRDILDDLYSGTDLFLFFGLSGTGKSTLGRALANKFECTLITFSGLELSVPYITYEQVEQRLEDIFKTVKESSPSLLLITEVHAIPMKNTEGYSISEFMVDGLRRLVKNRKVIVVLTTTRPDVIDKDLLRRLNFSFYFIPQLDVNGRQKLIEKCFERTKLSSDIKIYEIASALQNYSAKEIINLCQKAIRLAIYESIESPTEKIDRKVYKYHIVNALDSKTSCTPCMASSQKVYLDFQNFLNNRKNN